MALDWPAKDAVVIRKRRDGLRLQVHAGRDPLTGRKRWVSRQVPGQTKRSYREANKIEAERGCPDRRGIWVAARGDQAAASSDRYILPNLGRAKVQQGDASTIDALYEHVRAHVTPAPSRVEQGSKAPG